MTSALPRREESVINAITWGPPGLALEFTWSDRSPVALTGVARSSGRVGIAKAMPLVEILTAGAGHVPASDRLVGTEVGRALRYVTHTTQSEGGRDWLELVMQSSDHGLLVFVSLEAFDSLPAVRCKVTVRNVGDSPVVLRQVTSWVSGLGGEPPEGGVTDDWTLCSGASDWLAEGRWSTRTLAALLPDLAEHLTGHNPRSSHAVSSSGTWSTGRELPTGVLVSARQGLAWMWQIEHNGAWRWDVGQDTDGCWLALSGPTDADAAWTTVLERGEAFHAVPVSFVIGTDLEEVVGEMTEHRRRSRRDHSDNDRLAVVFNDYMNTLNGDPTTEKLLPLIKAAGAAGAEVFCIDAGWYDNDGNWWDSVGEWLPSSTRFPQGLGEVVDAIRNGGMTPGLWLEPEVVGVRSPVATRLPDGAFLSRHGQRLVEHHRFHLDLRHPAARAHLDDVVDRLVAEFGLGYFKFDYNINPGIGTDRDTTSLGAGLLDHNRAHLDWLDSLLDRHPDLVIENCASGGMRMDPAMLSRIALQSTSDQQDFLRYPPIAASAPMSMPPEQAASWAYPQPGMTEEEAAFCLVTALLGRFYLSGFLNNMDDGLRRLVIEAVQVAKDLKKTLRRAKPAWPMGLPAWQDPWVSLAVEDAGEYLVSVWRRGGPASITLSLPRLKGQQVEVSTIFPVRLPEWSFTWDSKSGALTIGDVPSDVSARTVRVMPVGASQGLSTVAVTGTAMTHRGVQQ